MEESLRKKNYEKRGKYVKRNKGVGGGIRIRLEKKKGRGKIR